MVEPIVNNQKQVDTARVEQPAAEAPVVPAEAAAAPESKPFFTSGMVKGLLITAAVVVGVMALVGAAFGLGDSIGTLNVNGALMGNLESGMAAGIEKGLDFLIKAPLGWATLAAGSAAGVYHEYLASKQEVITAPDPVDQTKIRELTQELEMQKTLNQELVESQAKTMEQAPVATQPAAVAPEAKPADVQPVEAKPAAVTNNSATTNIDQKTLVVANNETTINGKTDSIYLANSTIQDRSFRASELKRRVETVAQVDVKAM